jgi:predicted MFS family arabinose efflux permease
VKTALLKDSLDYVRLWTAGAISNLGSRLSLIAFPLLVLSLGGSALKAGAVASCSLAAGLALRLPGGHIADLVDRRRLMLGADLVRLLALGSIPLAGAMHGLGYPQLLVVAVVEGATSVLFGPAAAVALRDVVPKERLTEAFAMNQARNAAIELVGPALGGLLFGVGRFVPFTVDAATYGISAVLLLGIRALPRARPTAARGGPVAGVLWLWHQPQVMKILLFGAVINLTGAAAELVVVVSLRVHGASGSTIGIVMACAGGGAVVGSVFATRIIAALGPTLLFVVSGAMWAVGFLVFALSGSAWVIGPLLVAMLAFAPASGVRLGEVTLGRAPADILGRVSTAEQFVTAGLASVGPLLAGVAVASIGAPSTWTILAVLCVAATAIAAVPVRRGRPAEADPMVESGGQEQQEQELQQAQQQELQHQEDTAERAA